ncbi:DnaJ domain-containing protein [Limtongia smithiae]|uniref:DnaJ domain-containing protein n=1 Tax=Limtongia smithiae TaxID=1125753 RepID=UPI0034D0110C
MSSSAGDNRAHNQGRQDRDYTPSQASAVNRVRRCKHHEYYAILDIEKTATNGDIKRAYRKLALLMHPDKNGAPGADEAFKMVSKAFQILSDEEKKRIYDQTGVDPDSRGGASSGYSSSSSAGGQRFAQRGGMYGDEISPDDLFNMFFGGGGGGFQTSFSGFGGPGIRIHSFGGGSPFSSFGGGAQPRRPQTNGANGANANTESLSPRMLLQLLPLLLLFIVPIISTFFDSSSSSDSGIFQTKARFEFTPAPPYTAERVSRNYKVPYYVNPSETADYSDKRLAQLDQRAEASFVRILQNKCDYEYDLRQRKLEESQGWFFVNQEKYEKAKGMKMESCDRLRSLGVSRSHR